MIFMLVTPFHVYLIPWVNAPLALCHVKELVGTFNQEKALVLPSSGFLCDCGNFADLRVQLYCVPGSRPARPGLFAGR